MSDTKRCPACGAQNAVTAEWCTLCLTRFESAPKPVPAPVEPEGPVEETPVTTETIDAAPPLELAAPPSPMAQAPVKFVREGERVRWVCPSCDTVNDLESGTCRICGTVMARLFAPETAASPAPTKSRVLTVALSALLPGLGHVVQGETATAVGRMLLYLWTAGISILLIARAPARGKGVVQAVGFVFAAAGVAIWLVSLAEAYRIANGDRRPLVRPRVITWVFTALTLALFLGVLVAAAAGRSS